MQNQVALPKEICHLVLKMIQQHRLPAIWIERGYLMFAP